MRKLTRRRAMTYIAAAGGALAGTTLLGTTAGAQSSFPSKTVQLVVPFPAGGTTDILGRMIAQELTEAWGQQVIVDNRAGATGAVGTRYVADSDPDGHTLVLAVDSSQITLGLLNPPPPYHPVDDFEPIGSVAIGPFVLLVHPSVPANTLAELADYAKENPGQLSVGSSGVGSVPHLLAEMLRLNAGIDAVHVPYSGAAPVMVALLAGEIQMCFLSAAVATQEVLTGTTGIKALAVASAERWPGLPDVPTTAEAGHPEARDESMFGLLAPAGTPREIVDKISADLRTALDTPEVRKQLLDLGFALSLTSPDEYTEILKETVERKRAIIEQANITGG